MFRIHIARNRQSLGEFTPEEVAEGLHSGKFLPTDLAWREPMTAWKPLSEWDNLPSVELTPPPLDPSLETPAPAAPTTVEPAWERRSDLGIIPALYESVRQIFSTPSATFRGMPQTGGLKGPLFFYTILATLATWASLVYNAVYYQMNPKALEELPAAVNLTPSTIMMSQIATAVLVPGLVVIWAFIMGGIFHFILRALGSQASFEATFRTFCYVAGATFVLQFIPICGAYLFWGVLVMMLTIAFREVHRISTMQAVAASTVPILLCCGLVVAGMAAAIGATVGAAALK